MCLRTRLTGPTRGEGEDCGASANDDGRELDRGDISQARVLRGGLGGHEHLLAARASLNDLHALGEYTQHLVCAASFVVQLQQC